MHDRAYRKVGQGKHNQGLEGNSRGRKCVSEWEGYTGRGPIKWSKEKNKQTLCCLKIEQFETLPLSPEHG